MSGLDWKPAEFVLSAERPYSCEPLLAYLKIRAIPGVEEVGTHWYRRSLQQGKAAGELRVDFQNTRKSGTVKVSFFGDLDRESVEASVKSLVDATAPSGAIFEHLQDDPLIGPLAQLRPGVRIPGTVDPFELAVRAILGQQVSVLAASKIAGKIATGWGGRLSCSGDHAVCRIFPGPELLAEAKLEQAGLPRSRARAIRELAAAVASRHLDLDPRPEELDAVRQTLLAIKGIGPWTASYICLRALGDRDEIPIGDLGLRQVAGCQTAEELRKRAEAWRPWRGYAAAYLWATFLPLGN